MMCFLGQQSVPGVTRLLKTWSGLLVLRAAAWSEVVGVVLRAPQSGSAVPAAPDEAAEAWAPCSVRRFTYLEALCLAQSEEASAVETRRWPRP